MRSGTRTATLDSYYTKNSVITHAATEGVTMTAKKQYPLRVDPELWKAVEKWASDELRSVNGQMEFIIRESLKRSGRLPKPKQ